MSVENPRRTTIGLIVVALLALAIVALPSGGTVVELIGNAVQAGFLCMIGYGLVRLYRTQGEWLVALPDRDRGLVYGAVSVAVLAIVGVDRSKQLWDGGIVLLLVLLAGCAAVVYRVWRQSHDLSF